MANSRVLVSIPCYNERDNIAPLIAEIHRVVPRAEVLVIDDNSPDGTGQVADELAGRDGRVHVLHRAGKLGMGTAILAGLRYGVDGGYDCVVNMDADFSHHPRYLPAMLEGMERHDLMIGSRYIPGGSTMHWPMSRAFMSWGVNTLVRLLLRIPARDTSGGYRCYSVALLKRANLDNLLSQGYSFQQEVLYRLRRAGARIGETPIIFEDRRAGSSKVNQWEVIRSLSIVVWLGIKSIFGLDRSSGPARKAGKDRPGNPASPS